MRRVVVTGMGLLTSLGNNKETSWNNLINAKSGIKKIDHFDVDDLPAKIAGYINNNPEDQKDEVIFNYNFYFKPGSYIPQDKILEDFEVYTDQHTRYNIDNKYISIIDTSFKDSTVYIKKLVAFLNQETSGL